MRALSIFSVYLKIIMKKETSHVQMKLPCGFIVPTFPLWGFLDNSLILSDIEIKTNPSGVIVHMISTLGGYFEKKIFKCPNNSLWGHFTNIALWGYLDHSLILYDIEIETNPSGVNVHVISTLGGYFKKKKYSNAQIIPCGVIVLLLHYGVILTTIWSFMIKKLRPILVGSLSILSEHKGVILKKRYSNAQIIPCGVIVLTLHYGVILTIVCSFKI